MKYEKMVVSSTKELMVVETTVTAAMLQWLETGPLKGPEGKWASGPAAGFPGVTLRIYGPQEIAEGVDVYVRFHEHTHVESLR